MTHRHFVTAALACALLSCSSDERSDSHELEATVLGERFAVVDGAGFIMDPMPCEQLEDAGSHTIVMVRLSTEPGVCELANETSFCGEKAGSSVAYLAVARADLDGDPVEPIGPGTYRSSDAHVVDANGVVFWVWSDTYRFDDTCAGSSGKEGGSGWITFDEVGPARIRGSASLTSMNGDVLAGSFDVALCAASDQAQCAALKGGCAEVTCVP
jgi:hypothetical protein